MEEQEYSSSSDFLGDHSLPTKANLHVPSLGPVASDEASGVDSQPPPHQVKDKPKGPRKGRIATTALPSSLPLVLPPSVNRNLLLVQAEDEALDLSGDVGAVGRIKVNERDEGSDGVLLDLKGMMYCGDIVPSNTLMVVSMGSGTEAKVEGVMNSFLQLRFLGNVFDAETVVEGHLEEDEFNEQEEDGVVPVDEGLGPPKTKVRRIGGGEGKSRGRGKEKSSRSKYTGSERGKGRRGGRGRRGHK